MTWDPNQYQKFSGHRLRPAIDLLSRIDVANPAGVFDLGAGTGAVTRLLAQRWPKALVTGVDGSGEMLAVAAADGGSIIWQQADIATWQPSEKADVLISNAALHWLPDHDRLRIATVRIGHQPRLAEFWQPGRINLRAIGNFVGYDSLSRNQQGQYQIANLLVHHSSLGHAVQPS